jgi:hypothetical protein
MPSLRTLLSTITPPTIGTAIRTFQVFNASNVPNNGGACCLWTVPAGVRVMNIELWGAGASGQGARCCEIGGIGPTTGTYALKTQAVSCGQTYTICAASSGCDACVDGLCCGITPSGSGSFVSCSGTVIACASGGQGANGEITRGGSFGYACCWSRLGCNTSCADIAFAGSGSVYLRNQYCHNTMYDITAGGMNTGKASKDLCGVPCFLMCGFTVSNNCPSWPGGVGGTGRACAGDFKMGQHSAGGLVKISFQ